MPRFVHFEITADNPERAVEFYRKVFDWKAEKWGQEDYWLVTTGEGEPGIDGAIMGRSEPFGPVTNTLAVPSIDEYAKKIASAGGKAVIPKNAIPNMGWVAYFQDTEGNLFGLFQEDAQAK